ncbi:hypothetical protein FRC00_014536 [Tulasnella sp. 408]|nr:hypothetical protein FRC00_014536 [Tulasnella sp. 408]
MTSATGNTVTQQSITRPRKKSVANSAITIATTTSNSHTGNSPTPATVAAIFPPPLFTVKRRPYRRTGRRQLHEPQDYRSQGAHVHPPRLPHALVLSRLEKAKPSVQDAVADVLRSGRVSPDDYALTDGFWDEEEDDDEEAVDGTAGTCQRASS